MVDLSIVMWQFTRGYIAIEAHGPVEIVDLHGFTQLEHGGSFHKLWDSLPEGNW